ncbi:VTC domain-containing protein [Adhaeribacter terreus]|uniref:VTC domain-containing protein n=1 Tax=Adhaeribacter terreus TaxID=529703 RepID=A0ABW0EAJ2_9BACT
MLRFERKFRAENVTFEEVLLILSQHRLSFRKAFPDRYINSIYLDTQELDYYNDNVAGLSDRVKQRIRWYGPQLDHIHDPTLEIKIKENQVGYKRYSELPSFKPGGDFSYELYMKQHLWLASNNIEPTVMVRYLRSYFLSFDKKVRITVDRQQAFYPVDKNLNFNIQPYRDHTIILELKYPADYTKSYNHISQDLPFRMTRNSKYVQAIMACYG